MAKDAKTKAKARALYEAGQSFREVAQAVGTSFTSVKLWAKKDGWEKGKAAPKIAQKEEEALEREAEHRGLTKARVAAKIAQRLEAKSILRKSDNGGIALIPMPAGAKVEDGGLAQVFGGTYYVTEDTRTQDKAIDQAIAVLGMAKVEVDAGEGLRQFFQSLRGPA